MMRNQRRADKGFTIIELMIASSVFAMILLILATAIINIGRIYYKGIASSRVQEAGRAVMEEITHAIQYGSDVKLPVMQSTDLGWFCVGDKRFSFLLNRSVVEAPTDLAKQSKRALTMSAYSGCSGPDNIGDPAYTGGKELIPAQVGIADIKITREGGSNLYNVTVRLFYGDVDDLQRNADNLLECKSGTGSRYCAVSQLSTSVLKRIQ